MSAFIVESSTIDNIVSSMLSHGEIQPAEAQQMGEQLLTMNTGAVNYRYDESNEPPKYCFRRVSNLSREQAVKSLCCFLYQCNEGDTESRPLFRRMLAFCNRIEFRVDKLSPEYQSATWG